MKQEAITVHLDKEISKTSLQLGKVLSCHNTLNILQLRHCGGTAELTRGTLILWHLLFICRAAKGHQGMWSGRAKVKQQILRQSPPTNLTKCALDDVLNLSGLLALETCRVKYKMPHFNQSPESSIWTRPSAIPCTGNWYLAIQQATTK